MTLPKRLAFAALMVLMYGLSAVATVAVIILTVGVLR